MRKPRSSTRAASSATAIEYVTSSTGAIVTTRNGTKVFVYVTPLSKEGKNA